MNRTTVDFDLRRWRYRLRLTQAEAARAVGMSLSAYRDAEYRAEDRHACNKTLALLALALENSSKAPLLPVGSAER